MKRSKRLPHLLLAACAVAMIGAGEGEKKPPFAGGPDTAAAAAKKPKTRSWTVKKNSYVFTFLFAPGIAAANEVVEVLVLAARVPNRPHPKYGSRIPLGNANIEVSFTNPAGENVGNFMAHAMPGAQGKYGLHMTPSQDGLYTVSLSGKTAKGKELAAELKMPVNVWPLPKELQGTGDEGGAVVRRVIRKPLQ